MMKMLSWIVPIGFVVCLSMMIVACNGNGDNGEDDLCNYENASEICQQAYNCCNQFLDFYEETGNPLADELNCEGYICFGMQNATCEEFIAQAVDAEEVYEQDWPDCN